MNFAHYCTTNRFRNISEQPSEVRAQTQEILPQRYLVHPQNTVQLSVTYAGDKPLAIDVESMYGITETGSLQGLENLVNDREVLKDAF